MGADVAYVMDRGRQTHLQMMPKSRAISKQTQRALKLYTDFNSSLFNKSLIHKRV